MSEHEMTGAPVCTSDEHQARLGRSRAVDTEIGDVLRARLLEVCDQLLEG